MRPVRFLLTVRPFGSVLSPLPLRFSLRSHFNLGTVRQPPSGIPGGRGTPLFVTASRLCSLPRRSSISRCTVGSGGLALSPAMGSLSHYWAGAANCLLSVRLFLPPSFPPPRIRFFGAGIVAGSSLLVAPINSWFSMGWTTIGFVTCGGSRSPLR